MRGKTIGFLVVSLVVLFYVPTACLAGLNWRGINLTQHGIYKGVQLPL